MSEAKVIVSVEQRIIFRFLAKEGCRLSEICSRLKRQYGEKTLSDISVYKWLHWQTKDFFLSGIRKLTDSWLKFIANQGEYVEK